jgi:hypothetical protein
VLASLDPGDPDASPISAQVTLPVERAGTLHGIGTWFTATLAPGITVSNGPDRPDRLNRHHAFLPLSAPVPVEPGATVELDLYVVAPDSHTRWIVTVRSASGDVLAESRHSTADSTLITREELQRTRPDHVPHLSPLGQARATALGLFDGEHTLAEIEAAVWSRHPGAFASSSEAAAFVSQLVASEAG